MAKEKSVTPTLEELSDLSKATLKLWSLDVNRLEPGKDYILNLQQCKTIYDTRDVAKDKLFKKVTKESIVKKKTFKLFYNLLDNYEREAGVAEVVTKEEIKENWDFINGICETPCMKYCHAYLVAKKRVSADLQEFKKTLYNLWFAMYRRGGRGKNDSSGFEHVFLGEIKNGKVVGFHNWVQFFIEEQAGRVDYQGYITHRRNTPVPSDQEQLISIQFVWGSTSENNKKDVSSSFIGTSPEFEVALYTLCFMFDEDEDHFVQVGKKSNPYKVNIKCHRWHFKDNPDKIGSCYPIALD